MGKSPMESITPEALRGPAKLEPFASVSELRQFPRFAWELFLRRPLSRR